MVTRRAFLGTLAGGLLAAPLAAEAQPEPKSARIGYVMQFPASAAPDIHAGFRDEMRQLGYAEGRNLTIEYRSWEGRLDRIPQIGAELASLGVDLILATNTVTAVPLVAATERIPSSWRRAETSLVPGWPGRWRGLAAESRGLAVPWADIVPKRIELLTQAVPDLRRVVVVVQTNQNPQLLAQLYRELTQAAKQFSVPVSVVGVDDLSSLERQIASIAGEKRSGMVLTAELTWWPHRTRISDLVVKHRLAAMYDVKAFAESGFLKSYGPVFEHLYRRAASYVAKILQGAKAGDLPIEQPTKFELVINLKTAKALGLTIPQSLLQRADLVIE